MMLSKYERALDDARRATQLDSTFVKVFTSDVTRVRDNDLKRLFDVISMIQCSTHDVC